jgi:hypothetical protein
VHDDEKEALYRRLERTKRALADHFDPVTKDRLHNLAVELENRLAAAEAEDADAPE